MNYLKVDNYIINVPLINIVNDLKYKYTSRKLNSVTDKGTEIVLTCVNKDHSNGCEQNPDAHINLDSSKAPFGWYHCFALVYLALLLALFSIILNAHMIMLKSGLLKIMVYWQKRKY